jgi:hypothetical protein
VTRMLATGALIVLSILYVVAPLHAQESDSSATRRLSAALQRSATQPTLSIPSWPWQERRRELGILT